MRSIVTSLLLVVSANSLAARDDDEWKPFSPKNGKFTIKMPGTPNNQFIQDINYEGGKSKLYFFLLELDSGNGAYGISYNDYLIDKIDDNVIKRALDLGRDGVVRGFKGKLIASKDIKFDNTYQGRDFTFEFGDGKRGREKMFLIDKRLYQIVVLGSEEMVKSKDADKFFDSFKIDGVPGMKPETGPMPREVRTFVLVGGTHPHAAPMPREIHTYVSKEGKFSARFPANLDIKIAEEESGILKTHTFLCEVKNARNEIDHSFCAGYLDVPPMALERPLKQIMDGSTEGAIRQSGGRLLSSTDLTFGPQKYPMRDILVEKDGIQFRTRTILVKSRLYVMVVVGSEDEKNFATTPVADRFFETFKILE